MVRLSAIIFYFYFVGAQVASHLPVFVAMLSAHNRDRTSVGDDVVLEPPLPLIFVSRETLVLCGSLVTASTADCTLTSITTTNDSNVCINVARFTPGSGLGHIGNESSSSGTLYDPDEKFLAVDLLSRERHSDVENLMVSETAPVANLQCSDATIHRGATCVLRACRGEENLHGASVDIRNLFWTHMLIDNDATSGVSGAPRGMFTVIRPSTTFRAKPVPRVPVVPSVLARRTQVQISLPAHKYAY